MNEKILLLQDDMNSTDILDGSDLGLKGFLTMTDQNGRVIFEEKPNKVLVGGALYALQKLFNVNTTIDIPRLNTDLSVEDTDPSPGYDGLRRENIITLFGVGTDGAGTTYGDVRAVDVKAKGITLANMIPFRYVPKASDLTTEIQAKYAMKDDMGTHYGYYLKKFEATPVIKSYFTDGTPVTSSVSTSNKSEDIDTYIEIALKVSKEDVREWAIALGGGLSQARINTVCFFFGYPVDLGGGKTEYRGVKAYSKVNFNNEPLDDDAKELNMVYRIYIK